MCIRDRREVIASRKNRFKIKCTGKNTSSIVG